MPDKFDYTFPNGKVAFWIFFIPTVSMLIVACSGLVIIVTDIEQRRGALPSTVFLVLSCCFFVALMTLAQTSFPAVRVRPDGIEVLFYFAFISTWHFLSWEDIDDVVPYQAASDVFRKTQNVMVISKHLPFCYLFPVLVYGRRIDRGFIILEKIQRYDDLIRVIYDKSGLQVNPEVFPDSISKL